jgi:hypothetical protein
MGRYLAEEYIKGLLTQTPLRSTTELGSFLDSARVLMEKGGRGDLFTMFEEQVRRIYPDLFAAYERDRKEQEALAEKFRALSAAVEGATEKLNKVPTPGGEGGDGAPEHAAGGLTRKDHRAFVHRNEFIIPKSEAMEYFAHALAGSGAMGGIQMPIQIDAPIYAQAGADSYSVMRQAYQGFMRGAHEMERRLNTMIKDRAPGRNG